MFVSEDGYITGSVDRSKLDEVKPKTAEAKAQLAALKGEAPAEQAAQAEPTKEEPVKAPAKASRSASSSDKG